MIVDFDEWRQDLQLPDGDVLKDVLFIRARSGEVEFHTPVFVGVGYSEEEAIKDAKAMLFIKFTLLSLT